MILDLKKRVVTEIIGKVPIDIYYLGTAVNQVLLSTDELQIVQSSCAGNYAQGKAREGRVEARVQKYVSERVLSSNAGLHRIN